MRPVARTRTIRAGSRTVWELVSNPEHLPRWWPGVQRVEDASRSSWTNVLRSPRGRVVRADFTRVDAKPGRRLVWRQEVEETPFERFLNAATTEITLAPQGSQATRVELCLTQRLRGIGRLGGLLARRAARRQLDEALDGLAYVSEGRTEPAVSEGGAESAASEASAEGGDGR